ncbi:MAG: hypothetical protein K5868_04220 [Lachnospiraceae bacterium]|nr:hypothetical protein [Lachnospiraceae bacterium]
MACFLVPATEAVVTTVVQSVMKNKEKKGAESTAHAADAIARANSANGVGTKTSFSVKLGWLNKMLWGGSALLAFEHLWHGEVVPYFPFLTAVTNGEVSDMLAEMSSVGVVMAILVTAVWGGMVAVSGIIEKRAETDNSAVENA